MVGVTSRATVRGVLAGLGSASLAYVALCIVGVLIGFGICATAPMWLFWIYLSFTGIAVITCGIWFGSRAYKTRKGRRGA